MIPASPSIGIGLTTKNRWDDLAVTLASLRDEGLDKLETLVIDDGSDIPMPAELRENFPWVRFERFEKSEGLIVQRNRIARLLSTEFYLSIDDDSFPVAGDLAAAADWMNAHPKVAALALQIIFAEDPIPSDCAKREPVPVRDFVGCGFMLRRELFLSLGGFEGRLYIYHEEPEYMFRAFQAGYEAYAYPAVVIRHNRSPLARENSRRTRYFMRNIVLLDLWFYPHPKSIVRAVGHLPLIFLRIPSMRAYWWSLFRGWVEGFFCYLAWWKSKRRLTQAQFQAWEARPVAAKVCVGSLAPY